MTRLRKTGTEGIDYPKFAFIKANEIENARVQRGMTAARRAAVIDFHPQLTRPVVVRKNKKDKGYLHIEGQLTLERWIVKYGAEVLVPCQVITDDRISDSVAIAAFNDTVKFSSADRLRAMLVDTTPNTAHDMREVVESEGLALRTIKRGATKLDEFAFRANPALLTFFELHGQHKFRNMLKMLIDCFCRPDDEYLEKAACTDLKFLRGLIVVYATCGTVQNIHNGFENAELSSADIIQMAKDRNENGSNGSLEICVATIMMEIVAEYA
jgi:hypothetical protein